MVVDQSARSSLPMWDSGTEPAAVVSEEGVAGVPSVVLGVVVGVAGVVQMEVRGLNVIGMFRPAEAIAAVNWRE